MRSPRTLTQTKAEDHREDLLRAADRYRCGYPTTSFRSGNTHYRPTDPSGTRPRLAPAVARRLAIAVAAVCAVTLIGVAVANARAATVVGSHGKVAGEGYGQWLRNSFRRTVSEAPSASVCQSERVNGTLVEMLLGGYSGKPERHRCRVPAHTPIYVNGLFAECSTVEKPPFHASTSTQLERCARRNLQRPTHLTATIDGRAVRHYGELISASPAYTIHLPKHNILGTTKRIGRSAAYGEGLLLEDLPAGTHTLHITGDVSGFTYDVTYQLHVARS